MNKEVSQSQKSLKRKALTLPMERPRDFSKYLLPNFFVLWLDVFWFCIVGCWIHFAILLFSSPGLPLPRTSTHSWIKEFFQEISFKSHVTTERALSHSSQSQGHLRLCLSYVVPSLCFFCFSSTLAVTEADGLSNTFAVDSHNLCSQAQLIK